MESRSAIFVSILILTHNAPWYAYLTLSSLHGRTRSAIGYEVIVVDNRSRFFWRILLAVWHRLGYIDQLLLLSRNSFFAEGNNLAARLSSPSATHLLLLNSDVECRSLDWLDRLFAAHRRGASSFGLVDDSVQRRADGFCFVIDKDLYQQFGGLDTKLRWWWAITKLQAQVLSAGFSVRAVRNHDHLLHHFGGRSGPIARYLTPSDSGADMDPVTVRSWFSGCEIEVVERA